MKANDILDKIKNIVGVELSEEKIELAEISLKNGTLLVSEEFTKGNAVFIKSEDGEMALPVGEYELEDGRTLFVLEEGVSQSRSIFLRVLQVQYLLTLVLILLIQLLLHQYCR